MIGEVFVVATIPADLAPLTMLSEIAGASGFEKLPPSAPIPKSVEITSFSVISGFEFFPRAKIAQSALFLTMLFRMRGDVL
jgi:hypothetical protein